MGGWHSKRRGESETSNGRIELGYRLHGWAGKRTCARSCSMLLGQAEQECVPQAGLCCRERQREQARQKERARKTGILKCQETEKGQRRDTKGKERAGQGVARERVTKKKHVEITQWFVVAFVSFVLFRSTIKAPGGGYPSRLWMVRSPSTWATCESGRTGCRSIATYLLHTRLFGYKVPGGAGRLLPSWDAQRCSRSSL